MASFTVLAQRVLALSPVTLFLLGGCSGDATTSPEEQNPPVDELPLERTQTIGPEGGSLEVQGFSLVVPAGAFAAGNELTVSSLADDGTFGDNAVSRTFRLEGLPSEYSQPLRVSVEYEGTLTEESFIAYGEALDDGGDTTVAYLLMSATGSAGYLVSELPSRGSNASATAPSSNLLELTASDPLDWLLMRGLTDMRSMVSPGSFFKVYYPTRLEVQADAVMGLLEDSYDTIVDDLGFSFSGWRLWEWPIQVNVRKWEHIPGVPFPRAAFGLTSFLTPDDAWSVEEPQAKVVYVSSTSMEQLRYAEIQQAAGPVLLGFALETYTPQDEDCLGVYHWLCRAVTDWSEEHFTSSSSYQYPVSFPDHEMEPFHGLRLSDLESTGDADRQGHGMSAVIKYLVDFRFGIEGLVGTYDEIWPGSGPIVALLNNVDALVADWWPDFFRKYVAGEIYNVSSAIFTAPEHLSGSWDINGDSDALKVFASSDPGVGTYPDLSAKLFLINLNHANIDASANMVLAASGDVTDDALTTIAYVLNGSSLEFLGMANASTGGLEIPGLRDYIDQGLKQFLVVVVNSDPSSNAGESDIDLKVEVEAGELTYNRGLLRVSLYGHYREVIGDETREYDDEISWTHFEAVGGFSGNTFVGHYSELGYTGTLTATLSDAHDRVTAVSWTQTYQDGGSTSNHAFSGVDIPVVESVPSVFKVEGEATCLHVPSVEYSSSTATAEVTLLGHSCTSFSYVTVSFRKQ